MKHVRTKTVEDGKASEEGSITLKPGETWVVDDQCMIMHQGYLADWVGYFKGDKFLLEDRPSTKDFLSPEGTCTFSIDYGADDPKHPPHGA